MLANPRFHGKPPLKSSFLHSLRNEGLAFSFSCPGKFPLSSSSFPPPLVRTGKSLRMKALNQSNTAEATNDSSQYISKPYSVKIPVGDRHIFVETGHIGRQASGSVSVTDGETIVYASCCLADVPSEPTDFYPLSVHYQERFSAAGRTSGGFFKREGRAKDHES